MSWFYLPAFNRNQGFRRRQSWLSLQRSLTWQLETPTCPHKTPNKNQQDGLAGKCPLSASSNHIVMINDSGWLFVTQIPVLEVSRNQGNNTHMLLTDRQGYASCCQWCAKMSQSYFCRGVSWSDIFQDVTVMFVTAVAVPSRSEAQLLVIRCEHGPTWNRNWCVRLHWYFTICLRRFVRTNTHTKQLSSTLNSMCFVHATYVLLRAYIMLLDH